MQVAAGLGSPVGVDYDADGTATWGTGSGAARTFGREAVAYTPDVRNPASILVNGGLAWMGNVIPRGVGANNSFIKASGLMTSRQQVATGSATPVDAYVRAFNINGTATSDNLLDSNNPNFPFAAAVANKQNIVNDGRDRLLGNSDGARDTDSIKPPDISSGGNFSRYLNLTKYSPSVAAGQPSGSLFGYGEGIYIDNAQDVEKVSTSGSQWQPMDDARLKRMLYSTETAAAANVDTSPSRLAKPYGVTQPTGTTPTSLEQKHLRGWIGPDEFRARGALIELDPRAGTVTVTRDELSDNITNTNTPPDDSKAWRDPSGTLTKGFRKVFPWPANGVIYAEGNARVRGGAFDGNGIFDPTVDPGRSITIVSGNNIYIDGSLNAGKRKVLLLAKNNLLPNPTALVQRNTAQTTVLSRAGTTLTVPDSDGLLFQPGDWVRMLNTVHRVVSRTNNTVTVDLAFTPTTGTLKAALDPNFGSGATTVPYYNSPTRIGVFLDVVQRRFRLAPGANAMRVVFNHSAEQKYAVQLKANNGVPPQTAVTVSNKLPVTGSAASTDPQSTLVTSKILQIDSDEGNEFYADPEPLASDFTSPPTSFSLNAVITDMLGKHPSTGVTWSYDASSGVLNNYGPSATAQPLFFFLAALHNRHSFAYTPAELLQRGEDILNPTPPATNVKMPMGTSVSVFSNLVAANPLQPQALTSIHSNAGARVTESVNQFGFNPQYDQPEDALTGDASFYTYSADPTAVATPAPSLGAKAGLQYDTVNSTLDARNVAITTPAVDGNNVLALRLNDTAVGTGGANQGTVSDYFDATNAPIPYYRLNGLKMEGLSNGIAGVTDTYDATTGEFQHLFPGQTMDIRAFAYAQNGSWLVVPGGYFDASITTDPTDPANPLPVRTLVSGSKVGVDLNRDGVISREEKLAAYRMRRYNYQVVFTGAIMEKSAALVSSEGLPNTASVSDWMDKWATFNFDSARPAGSDFDDTKSAALKTDGSLVSQASYIQSPPAPGASATFGNISYNFDPAVMDPSAANIFVSSGSVTDTGLRLPVLPDLLPG